MNRTGERLVDHNDAERNGPRTRRVEQLPREARKLYRHLKARHVDHRGFEDRCVAVSHLHELTGIDEVERAVHTLVERGLAVSDGEVVMWRPRLSPPLEETLVHVRNGRAVDREEPWATCLEEMGLIEWVRDGYRFRWSPIRSDRQPR